jgi:hypothetical protein
VRALATAVAAAAGAMTGVDEVTRHLPPDLNPKLREALSEALGELPALPALNLKPKPSPQYSSTIQHSTRTCGQSTAALGSPSGQHYDVL